MCENNHWTEVPHLNQLLSAPSSTVVEVIVGGTRPHSLKRSVRIKAESAAEFVRSATGSFFTGRIRRDNALKP